MHRRGSVLAIALAVLLLTTPLPAAASSGGPEEDAALAQRFAPVFYFHPAEVFRPQPVDVILARARLRQSRRLWFDVNILLHLDLPTLLELPGDPRYMLDVWYGDEGRSAYTNYTSHRSHYQTELSPEAGGPPVTVYAHVVRDEDPRTIAIQYWALYYYNDWFNKHEGDWELVEVLLDRQEQPQWVIVRQHHGGTRRAWSDAPVVGGTHPVYVARGSHANYFAGNETYPNSKDVGRARIEIMDRTGDADPTLPDVILLPDREGLLADPSAWPGAEWLTFRGHWGEKAPQRDFGGPLGPADKGTQWEQPVAWGLAQPLDLEVWYTHRLRVAAA